MIALVPEGDDCLEYGSVLSHGSMVFVHAAPRIFHAELQVTWQTNHLAINVAYTSRSQERKQLKEKEAAASSKRS